MATTTAQFDLLFKVQGSPELANMQAQLKALGAATENAKAKFNGFSTAAANMNNASQAVSKGSSMMASRMQNAAFQLQDFIVMTQNGTSASKALAMQLPQVLGGFGAVGAAAGVAAGLLIPFAANLAIVQENIDRIGGYAAAAGAILGGKFLLGVVAANGGFVALTKAVFTFTVSLQALKGALIATGFGALVVLLGEAVAVFIRLKQETGGWGEAAGVVFRAIGDSVGQFIEALWEIKTVGNAIWSAFSSAAQTAFSYVLTGWQKVLEGLSYAASSTGMDEMAASLTSAASSVQSAAQSMANGAAAAWKEASASGKKIADIFTPTEAQKQIASAFWADYKAGADAAAEATGGVGGKVKDVNDKLNDTKEKFKETWDTMSASLSDIKTPLMEFIESLNQIGQSIVDNFATGLTDAFMSMIEGTKSAKEAMADFAKQFLLDVTKMIMKATILFALQSALGMVGGGRGGLGSILGGLLGGGASPYGMMGVAPMAATGSISAFGAGGSPGSVVGRIIPSTPVLGKSGMAAPQMNVSVINQVSGAEVRTRQTADGGLEVKLVERAKAEIVNEMMRGGSQFDKALTSGYGLRRVGR